MTLRPAPARARRRSVVAALTALVATLSITALGPVPQASAATPTLRYVGSASAAPTSTSHTVRVPAAVTAGDTLLLFMTSNLRKGTLTGPAGWTLLQSREGSASRGRVWTKRATLADRNRAVTARTSVTVKSELSVVAYRSSAGTSAVTRSVSGTVTGAATAHRTPVTSATQAGSWLVSYWGGKAASTPTWTPPTNVTRRTTAHGVGANQATALVADSGKAVANGSLGARLARTSKAITNSQLFSVVVSPGAATVTPPANRAPVAAFTSSCTVL